MKSKRFWPGRAKQIEHQLIVDRDAAKIHRHGSLILMRSASDEIFPLGGNHINLANRADKLGLTG